MSPDERARLKELEAENIDCRVGVRVYAVKHGWTKAHTMTRPPRELPKVPVSGVLAQDV